MVLVCMGRRERCTTDGVGESWLCGERGKKVCLHYVDSGFRVTLAANPVRKCSAAPAGWPLPLSLSDGGGVVCLSVCLKPLHRWQERLDDSATEQAQSVASKGELKAGGSVSGAPGRASIWLQRTGV